ncbi:fatty acid-binding protein, brain [Pangasianodon hypophthalmus]|uniref:fatty acid-binding protein, brain n=1 Tax=Pangasianodon hypophthalmus TaxID=310915 RepID=UPI002307F428|nr:fatty acid-binding protein, brain [Pangasianodon hypophthalmus]
MDVFFGSWKFDKSENFDDYMKAIGVNDELISVANVVKPVITISQEEESVVITTQTVISKKEIRFQLGEEFEEKSIDGRSCKSVINLEGEKLVQVQKDESREITIVREIQDGKLIMTLTCDEVTAVVTYEKV